MKFTIDKQTFTKAIAQTCRSIAKKVTMPIMSGMKIDVTDKGMYLTGFNGDIGIKSYVPSKQSVAKSSLDVKDTGSIVIRADLFQKIVKSMPKKEVAISTTPKLMMSIDSGKSHFHLKGLKPADYPHLPKLDHANEMTLSSDALRAIIGSTVFSISKQENQPLLTGINLSLAKGYLHAIATDSHRLTDFKLKSNQVHYGHTVDIPGKAMKTLQALLPNKTVPVKVDIGANNHALFQFSDLQFYTRLIEGQYPDTKGLMPKRFAYKIKVGTDRLHAAIGQTMIVSHASRANVVHLKIDATDSSLTISTDSPDVGQTKVTLPAAVQGKGKGMSITFNPDYLADALKAIQSDSTEIDLVSSLRPFTIKPTDVKDTDTSRYVQLVTPIRTF